MKRPLGLGFGVLWRALGCHRRLGASLAGGGVTEAAASALDGCSVVGASDVVSAAVATAVALGVGAFGVCSAD